MKAASDSAADGSQRSLSGAASAAGMDCSACHQQPRRDWADGLRRKSLSLFHANIGTPYPGLQRLPLPLMADRTRSDLPMESLQHAATSPGRITFRAARLAMAPPCRGEEHAIASTLLARGRYHPALSTQPRPASTAMRSTRPAATRRPRAAGLHARMGGTSTKPGAVMNHGSSSVAEKDCVVCHASDARLRGAVEQGRLLPRRRFRAGQLQGMPRPHQWRRLVAGTKNTCRRARTQLDPADDRRAPTRRREYPAGTYDQITQRTSTSPARDCKSCTPRRRLDGGRIQGKEWPRRAPRELTSASPLVMNGTTGDAATAT